MSENNVNSIKPKLLTGLLVLLTGVVGVQAYYMADIKQQLNGIHAKQAGHNILVSDAGNDKPQANLAVHDKGSSLSKVQQGQTQKQATATPPVAQKQVDNTQHSQQSNSIFDNDFFNSSSNSTRDWNPYEEIQRMQRDMDRVFNHAFSRFNDSPDFQHLFRQGFTTPEMDVQEDENNYIVIMNLPGSNENDVTVNLDGEVLTVKGEQKFEKKDKDDKGNVIFQERRSGSFQRSVSLPGPVKQSAMQTKITDGVLTVTIPKES